MSRAWGLQGSVGRRERRRGRLLERLGDVAPRPGLERLGVPGPWGPRAQGSEAGDEASRVAARYRELRALPRRVRRALQRRFALTLAELALLLALWQGPGWAATINVTGGCTLVDAIIAANTDSPTGGCPAGSGADTLVLSAGSTLTLTSVDNSTYGPTGLPVVASIITIVGQGSTIKRAGAAPDFRLLAVGSTGNLTLQNLTLQGGKATTGSGNSTHGGGVFNNGTLTLSNSTLSGNSATNNGGAVYNAASRTLTLTNSTLSGNSASYGGGVYNKGTLGSSGTLTNSTLSGNSASNGGSVYNNTGTLMLTNSTLSGNSASVGGGVNNSFGTLTLG